MVSKSMYRLLVITWITLFAGCAPPNDSSEIEITAVNGSKTDNNEIQFCSDFTVSVESTQKFFKKAEPISLKQLHDNYDYLPCFSYGTANVGDESCSWEMRAGNTAELQCGNTVQYFACDICLNAE
ncbi:hypothetical protein [uncultured Microbulbifer sp.]|uniref:hypothetical protein n=1 Tax=uncultured Microbulbifer sp. TaxID=348147 RepID=UPI00260DD648|nr:hypothetical protein [uncultured Microbulbifer sp.]